MRTRGSLHNAKFNASPAGLLFLALALYICEGDTLVAAFFAALAHELGHVAAMLLLGLGLRGFCLEPGGPCIAYERRGGAPRELICALSGPAAGLIYALSLSRLYWVTHSDLCALSSGISLALSLFNLLPVLPLDGGRALEALLCAALGEKNSRRALSALSIVFLALLLPPGLYFALRGQGLALVSGWIWLLWAFLAELGIVKSGEMI